MTLVEERLGETIVLTPADAVDARVFFTTRIGGHSEGPFEGLNLSFAVGDLSGAVAKNRSRLASLLEIKGEWTTIDQVHGNEAVVVGHSDEVRQADAAVTSERDLPIAVMTADCLPIALVAEGTIAVIHAGWRGLVSGVIANAMKAMPSGVKAWIGPCIGPCHYEVGHEILEAYERAHGTENGVFRQDGTSLRMDLQAAAALQLESSGAEVRNFDPPCTYCDARFFSHRREAGRTGRQAVIVWR